MIEQARVSIHTGMRTTSNNVSIHRTESSLGADIVGFDFENVAPEEVLALRRAIQEHLVVRLRGYSIDDRQHATLGRMFGALHLLPGFTRNDKVWFDELPEMFVISNIKENGERIGELGDGELNWHTDLPFEEVPPALSFLRALEVPGEGGDTGFVNMYLMYERLSESVKRRIDGLKLKHQASHDGKGNPRYGFQELSTEDVRTLPGTAHPLVRTHPETGRRSLYLGRRFGAYLVGLPVDESEALLDELWAGVDDPGITWYQRWQAGDMLIWDNRCTMHRRDPFPASLRRRMHRVVTVGSKPF